MRQCQCFYLTHWGVRNVTNWFIVCILQYYKLPITEIIFLEYLKDKELANRTTALPDHIGPK